MYYPMKDLRQCDVIIWTTKTRRGRCSWWLSPTLLPCDRLLQTPALNDVFLYDDLITQPDKHTTMKNLR